MNNLLDYTLEELKVWMKDNGESAFRGEQILSWIYKDINDLGIFFILSNSLTPL